MSRPKETRSIPLNFLLGCSDSALCNFELAKLSAVADLRKELHLILDRVIDEMAQAAVTAWFRQTDLETLKRALENPEDVLLWAQEQIRSGQRSEVELVPRAALPAGTSHLASALRYAERNMAKGLCSICPQPLAHHSVQYCEKHLAYMRNQHKPKGAKGDPPGSIGWLYGDGVFESGLRSPEALARLAKAREKQTRTTAEQRALWDRVARQLGMSAIHVRNVATGVKRSPKVLAALEKERKRGES